MQILPLWWSILYNTSTRTFSFTPRIIQHTSRTNYPFSYQHLRRRNLILRSSHYDSNNNNNNNNKYNEIFTNNDIQNVHNNNNDDNNKHDNNHGYDFESLIQAATSTSFGSVIGGDFAGLAATFNPGDGSYIPIPHYLIPDALLEWGQEPKCLEVLVSEEIIQNHDDEESNTLTRITTTVLPDTGCSIDNLETIKAVDEIDLESQWSNIHSHDNDNNNDDSDSTNKSSNVVGLQYPIGDNNELRIETIFDLDDIIDGQYRMRVAIDVVPSPPNTFGIQSPMVVTLERRTSSVSSGGTIADGGGLDGRTVSMLLGERLKSAKTFVDEPLSSSNYDSDSIKHVALPGNIAIAYGWLNDDDWMLQVSHIGSNGLRRVVSRQFTVMENGELDFEVQSWVEDPQQAPVV